MSEQHKSKIPQEETNRQAVLVVQNITLNAVLFIILGIYLAIQTRGAWQAYQFIILSTQVFIIGLISLALIRRGQLKLGVWIFFTSDLIAPIWASLLVSKLGYVAIAYILVTTFFMIQYAIPKKSKIAPGVLAVFGLIISYLVEFVEPTWRLVSPLMLTIAPILTGFLGAVFIAIIGLQAWRGSLRTKLIVAFLGVTLIPLGIVFFINNRSATQILTNSSDAALVSVAAQTASSLDTFIGERVNDVRVESRKHIFVEYLSLPISERAGSETEIALNTDLLSIARRDQTFITSVGIIDKYGLSLADTTPLEVGVDKSERNYFIGARDTLLPYVSPVEISGTTGQTSIYFTAPILDKNENFLGVLRIRYNATVIQSIISKSAEKSELDSVDIMVFDENHIRLADNRSPELILKSVVPLPADTTAKLQAENRLPPSKLEADISTNLPALEDKLNNLDKQPVFIVGFDSEGESGQEEGTAVHIKNMPWVVATGQDRDIFLAPLNQQSRADIILALIIAGFAALAALLVAQTIANPVVRLTKVAERIAGGEINMQAKVESRDEIGTLAGTFNIMTAQLRDFIATLERRVADRTKALATSSEVSRRLSTILDQKELVKEVVNQINNAFGYYHTQIYFYDVDNENLVMAGGTGEAGEKMLAQFHKVAKGRGLVGRAAESNKSVLVSDTSQNPEWLPNPLLPDTKAEMAIPISLSDQVLGVLDVQHNIVDGLEQEDVDSLQSIANQIAVALQNIRQYENTQKIASDMSVVATVGIAISTITDSEKLLQEVVDLSRKSFNLYHAHIYLLNEAGDALELTAGAGEVGRKMVSEKRSIPLDSEKSLVARAARAREGVVVNDVTLAPDFLPNSLLPDTRSEMAVPMLAAGKVIGVLDVQSETANRFTEVDVSINTTLASQVAVALQNARSFAQSQRQAERETKVNLITQRIQGTTSVEAALQMAARELGHALGMKQTLVKLDSTALAKEHKGNINE